MTPRSSEAAADDDYLDEDADGQEGIDESDLFAPPEDDEYDRIKYFRGLEQLPRSFQGVADLSRDLLSRPYASFAARYSGGDDRTGAHDPEFFTQRVLRSARLNRWVANSQFKGVGAPGVLATLPGSLIAHFTVAAGEAPMRLGKSSDYPTNYGARAVTRLLAYAADEDALNEATRLLGKRAVQTLLSTLIDSAELGMSVTWLTHEGQATTLTPKRAEKGIATLDRVPPMQPAFPVSIIGALDRPNAEQRVVRVQPVNGGPMLLHYAPGMQERIRDAWGKYIVGTMVVQEPENPSLPRAPRRVRTLTRIERVVSNPSELPEPLT